MFELYKIITPTGKTYYGQHFNRKYPMDDGYMGSGRWLRESLKKYGKENHIKIILTIAETQELIDALEIGEIWYAKNIADETCLNILEGGADYCTRKGIKISEVTRQKMSEAQKNRTRFPPWSDETRKKQMELIKTRKRSRYWLGKTLSEETKRKISNRIKGRKLTLEHRQKIGDAHRGRTRLNNYPLLADE